MIQKLSQLFHLISKNKFSAQRLEQSAWPEEWKTTFYKIYPRLRKIVLSNLAPEGDDFFESVKNRRSERNFSGEVISNENISIILKYSCGNTGPMGQGRYHRAQPSAGGRFPIETYILIFNSGKDFKSGIYHYSVKDHLLDVLREKDFSDNEINEMFIQANDPNFKKPFALIVLTAVFWRNQNKYNERGYRLILQESGHIGQNIYLISEILKLKCVALSGIVDAKIEKFLDIDGVTESAVYAIAVGK